MVAVVAAAMAGAVVAVVIADAGHRRLGIACLGATLVVTTMAWLPIASAAPDCVSTTPTTTQCQTPGHSQIVTSPPAMNDNSWWPYGGFAFGFPR